MFPNPLSRTEKFLYIRNVLGKTLRVVREHYLRDDVPCKSKLCEAGCHRFEFCKSAALLPVDVTHYIIPHLDIVVDYLELLEFSELRGIIFPHTIVQRAQQEGGRRVSNRVTAIIRDIRRESVIFFNEFHKATYCERQPKESGIVWQNRCTYRVAVWFYIHLAMKMPIIILTENNQFITEYENLTFGIFVLSVQDYLKKFWPDWTAALDIYESLSAALTNALEIKGPKQEYKEHLRVEILEAGIKAGIYMSGILQVGKHYASKEAFVIMERKSSADIHYKTDNSDILISGMEDRNRAIHGDLVAVELLPKAQWKSRITSLKDFSENEEATSDGIIRPTGKVVGILQRNWRNYVATFADGEEFHNNRKSERLLVISYDWRIPKIRISTRQAEALKDDRIVVRIDHWKANSVYPNGHFVKSLGKIGELETEIATILVENSISAEEFSEAQRKELPVSTAEQPWKISETEVSKRKDLRKSHLIFSIDPKGCKDVDDALSVRKFLNGHLELGVHIADVTHFVQLNSLTDLEARVRATTVYLADRHYNMLPEVLSSDICSLWSGKDRYAVSLLWELDDNLEVVDLWYGGTVINSSFKLVYEVAQSLHDGDDFEKVVENIPELKELDQQKQKERLSDLGEAISLLKHIAETLKSKRLAEGGLELEGIEVHVQLDDTKKIENLIPKEPLQIHEWVAECMIFANHSVANVIEKHFPHTALLRHHPPPLQEKFEDLLNCARVKGFQINTHSNKTLAKSLDKCIDKDDPFVNKILRNLATLAMPNALYFSLGSYHPEEYYHYGLALARYTHFTSPIRRYADVIVHRLLSAINQMGKSTPSPSNKEMEELCRHINQKNKASQNAQRKSLELFQALYFQDRPSDDPNCQVEGIIFALRSNGALVFIPQYGLKGPAYLCKKDGAVAWVENGQVTWTSGTLTKTSSSLIVSTLMGIQIYTLFDHLYVRIEIQKTHCHPHIIRFELLSSQVSKSANRVNLETLSSAVEQTDIVKEVSKSLSQYNHGPKEPDPLPKINEINLYRVIQDFKMLALQDDSWDT